LSLQQNPIGGQGMLEFMNSPHLGSLTRWDLTDTQLSLVDARNLSRAGSLNQLEELLLSHNKIGDAGLRAIANTPRLGTLRKLAVAENHIALEGLRALADSAHLTDLRVLDLSGNEIGDAGLTLMAAASNYARLTELDLAGSSIQPEGLASFANSPYFTRLETLNLSHNPLGKGLPRLLESRIVENLQSLSLRHCDLDSQSVRGFLTRALPLKTLDLRDNPLINHSTRENLLEKYGPRLLI
jgi:Ran GTPase-activating protein (RanGAP) involved in mRNA processing and transport